MKKFFFSIVTLLVFAGACFALDYPRWQNMPIKVYVPTGNKYSQLMTKAFNEWESVTNGTVRFKFVNSKEKSDISVNFTGYLKSTESGKQTIGLTHYGAIKKGFFTQNQIDIDTNKYFGDRSNKRGESIRIYHVMLHEIGHAIGLKHSEDINSLMYYAYEKNGNQNITRVDISAIQKKYLQ